MSQEAVEKLVERAVTDSQFRAQLAADPEAAVRAAGLELDAAEMAAVKAADFNLTAEELEERASKFWWLFAWRPPQLTQGAALTQATPLRAGAPQGIAPLFRR